MYLVLGVILIAQQGPTGQRTRPSPVVRDSGVAVASDSSHRRRQRHEGFRRAVTPELEASAFKDANARNLLLRARAARLAQDSALVAYDAMSYERVSAGMGFGRIGRDRLIYRYESAAHVRWQQGVGARIEVRGARTAVPMISAGDADDRDRTRRAATSTTPT